MSIFANVRLARPRKLTASPQLVYTVPPNRTAIVTSIGVANKTAVGIAIFLHLCVGTDPPDDTNVFIPGGVVDANTLVDFTVGQVIHSGDTIQAYGDGLTLHLSGIEIT